MSFTLLSPEAVAAARGTEPVVPAAGGGAAPGTPTTFGELQALNPQRAPAAVTSAASTVSSFVSGLGAGALEDPFINKAVDLAFGEEFSAQLKAQFSAAAGDTSSGSVGRLVGEYLPLFVGAGKFFKAGEVAGVKVAGALGQAGRLGKGAENIAARQAGGDLVENFAEMTPGMVERIAQAGGRSTGIAGFEAARAAANGETLEDTARAAAVGFVSTAAFEGLFIAGGRALGAAKAKATKIETETTVRPLLADSLEELSVTKGKFAGYVKSVEKLQHKRVQELDLAKGRVVRAEKAFTGAREELGRQRPSLFPELGAAKRDAKQVIGRAQTLAKQEAKLLTQESKMAAFLKSSGPERAEKTKDFLQETKRLRNQQRILQKAIDDPGSYMSTRATPFDPKGFRLFASKVGLSTITTPEGLSGKLGGVAARLVHKPLAEADMAITIRHAAHDAHVMGWHSRVEAGLNLSKAQKKDPRAFLELEDAWERESFDGVIGYLSNRGIKPAAIDDIVKVYEERKTQFEDIARRLEKMGAEPLMTQAQLRELGVKEYSHHMMLPVGPDAMQAQLAKRFGEAEAAQLIKDFEKTGLAKSGAFDWNRSKAGSLMNKVDDPDLATLYETNPWVATRDYLHRGSYRLEMGSRFGLNGELVDPIVAAVRADAGHGTGTLVANIFGSVMGKKFVDDNLRQLSLTATSYQIVTKLGMGVYPNMSQAANIVAFTNFKTLAKSMAATMKGSESAHIKQAVGLVEGSQIGMQAAMGQTGGRLALGTSARTVGGAGKVADKMETLADFVLRKTGFSWVEANNRTLSGYAGRFVFRDNLQQLASGKLRGRNFDEALRQMNSLGVTPSETRTLVQRIKAEGEEFLSSQVFDEMETRAIYRAAQLTQFTPGALRRPAFWNHPVGKVVFQFKSFALNQGRFMKDQVFAEAAAGNLGPLAYVLSVYPVAGELVGDVKAIIKGKNRDAVGWYRGAENFTQMGGFGLMHNTLAATQFRGGLARDVLGPTVSGMLQAAEHMGRGEFAQIPKDIANDPTIQNAKFYATLGAAAAFRLGTAVAETETVQSAGELIQEFRRESNGKIREARERRKERLGLGQPDQ